MGKPEWQTVVDTPGEVTERMRVEQGYIYKVYNAHGTALVFVPDLNRP